MTNSAQDHGSFSSSIAAITAASALMQCDCAGKSVVKRTGDTCFSEANHVLERAAIVQEERPGRVCVLILGEFKAGKSTLINALLRREVAAVDVFEMTTAVCRVVPISTGIERAELRSHDPGVLPLRLSLDEFLVRSQSRNLGPYTRVNLHIKSDLDLVLIDTPGLGATLSNEIVAVDSMATADVILWTLDADNLGGAREAAVINGISENGLPLICVLTKADTLAAEEVEEATEYLAETFDLPSHSIIPVSAVQALQHGTDEGIEKLRRYLIENIAPRGAILREQALAAHAADIAAEMRGILDQVLVSLDAANQMIEEYTHSMYMTAGIVTEDVCSELASRLRDGLYQEINARIDARLGEGDNVRGLSENDISLVLQESTQKLSGQKFWSALSEEVEQRIQAEWSEGIRAQTAVLMSTLNEVRHDADKDAARIAEELLQVQVYESERKQSSVVYGLETVSAAVIGTVFSGGNIFIGIITAAPLFYRWYKSNEDAGAVPSGYERRLLLQEGIKSWVGRTVDSMMGDKFYQKLLSINECVAAEASSAYAHKQDQWPLSQTELKELICRCQDARESLVILQPGKLNALPAPE